MVRIETGNMAGFGTQRRVGGRNGLNTDLMQLRLQEKRREMQLREKENERIKLLNERMDEVRSDSNIDRDLQQIMLDSLSKQINQIHENRAEREIAAAEREMMRKKAVIEETTQVREDMMPANEDDDEGNVMGLTRIAAGQDRITHLKQVRAGLVAEAGHLERAIHSPNSNYTLIGSGHGVETTISGQRGLGANDYRNQQLAKLNLGIVRTDAAINQAISSLYRDSARMQEEGLAERNSRDLSSEDLHDVDDEA